MLSLLCTIERVAERLELPFSNDEILSGYEEFDSSGTDLLTTWVIMSEQEILVQHMVDIQEATAEFREVSERKPTTSSHKNSSSKHFGEGLCWRGWMSCIWAVAATEAVVPQFVSKNKPYPEASGSPKVEKLMVSKSWWSQGCNHCDLCYGAHAL